MSADQYFYVVFSTFTNREVFGLLTYYYSEVLLYSAIYGSSMLAITSFSVNNCMMYRDAFLVVAAMIVHMVYVYTQDQNVLFGCFGMYILYLIMDWKNDSLTHLGMKILGKIKDDDSFEGDYPLQMKRRNPTISPESYEEFDLIIEENKERYSRNLNHHEIFTKLWVHKDIRENRIDQEDISQTLNPEEVEVFKKRVYLRMKFAEAVYKHIFYLRYILQCELENRLLNYERNKDFPGLAAGTGGFPKDMNPGDFDNDKFEEQHSMKSIGNADEDNDNLSSSPRKRAKDCRLISFSKG